MQLIFLYILTFLLVVDCLFLGLLILMQLPKKESGLGGAAFGGGAVDALIGAGSGNVLTKATKVSATAFFVLIVSLSVLHANYAKKDVTGVAGELQAQGAATPAPAPVMPVITNSTATPAAAPVGEIPVPTSTTTPAETTPATEPQQ